MQLKDDLLRDKLSSFHQSGRIYISFKRPLVSALPMKTLAAVAVRGAIAVEPAHEANDSIQWKMTH